MQLACNQVNIRVRVRVCSLLVPWENKGLLPNQYRSIDTYTQFSHVSIIICTHTHMHARKYTHTHTACTQIHTCTGKKLQILLLPLGSHAHLAKPGYLCTKQVSRASAEPTPGAGLGTRRRLTPLSKWCGHPKSHLDHS